MGSARARPGPILPGLRGERAPRILPDLKLRGPAQTGVQAKQKRCRPSATRAKTGGAARGRPLGHRNDILGAIDPVAPRRDTHY